MTVSGTLSLKNGVKPGKDSPPAMATRSSEQQVRTQTEAIATLKAAKIISPTTDITSLAMLTKALLKHMITLAKPGQQSIAHTPLADKKFIEAVTVLIQHYSEGSLTELVNKSMKAAMDNATGQLQSTIKEEMEKIRKENTEASTLVVDMAKQVHMLLNKVADGTPSYSNTAAGKIGNTNANLFAQQAIHAWQMLFKMTDAKGYAGNGKDNASIQDTAQKALENMGAPEDVQVQTVSKNKKRQEILMEMTTEAGADWLKADGRMACMEHVLGSMLRNRVYQTIIKFVPISFNPETDTQTLLTENGIDQQHFALAHWIKPIE